MTGERILVVEDNELNMKLFLDVLAAGGYRTLEATSGGSTFTWIDDLKMSPPLLGWLALFLYSPIVRWTFRRTMRNLAHRIGEAGPLP